jgi:hypothetical protein
MKILGLNCTIKPKTPIIVHIIILTPLEAATKNQALTLKRYLSFGFQELNLGVPRGFSEP